MRLAVSAALLVVSGCFGPNPMTPLACSEFRECPPSQTCDNERSVCLPEAARVVSLTAGDNHTCALLDTGGVRCWGDRFAHGYPGRDEPVGDNEFPASVGEVFLGEPATALASSRQHKCAILESGAVRCWGPGNAKGAMATASRASVGVNEHPAEVDVVQVGEGGVRPSVVAIAGGIGHFAVLTEERRVQTWGEAIYGRLGYGQPLETVGDDELPYMQGFVPGSDAPLQLAAGGLTTCTVLSERSFRCWGSVAGRDKSHVTEPADEVEPITLNAPIRRIVMANDHGCVLLTSGAVRCWGWNVLGQLGYGHNTDGFAADQAEDIDLGGPARDIVAGMHFTCALLDHGGVRCWGIGEMGQLGYGTTDSVGLDNVPADVGDIELGGPAAAIAAGFRHACAILVDGTVRCWGANESGQLGIASVEPIGDNELPIDVEPVQVFAN